MILEDFTCLARTVPEDSKKYGHKVCMAGYSQELGHLIRVYPLPVQNPLKANHQYTLGLCRNSQDSRWESWQLVDRVALYDSQTRVSLGVIRQQLLEIATGGLAELNDNRSSLGVIHATAATGHFVNRCNKDPLQADLFEYCDRRFGAKAVTVSPYISFYDEDGHHDLQLREWGCYEWIRKEPARAAQLWENMKLGDDRECLLLVGNMANRRNVWLVIKAYTFAQARMLPGMA